MRSRKNLSQALTGIMRLRVNVQCNDIFQAEDLNSSPFFCKSSFLPPDGNGFDYSFNDKDAKSFVGTCIFRAYYRCLLHILPIVYCIMLVANISLISLPIVYYAYCLYLFELYKDANYLVLRWSLLPLLRKTHHRVSIFSASTKKSIITKMRIKGTMGGQPIHLKNTFVVLYFLFTLFFFNYALFVASILSVFKGKLPLATAKNLKFPMRNEELSVLVLDASQGNLYTLQTSSPLSS